METTKACRRRCQVVNGTHYHHETPEEVVQLLEHIRQARIRIRVYFGDAKSGLDWDEKFDIYGRIGRSTGDCKIPLLVYRKSSWGGPALLDDCIVKIEYANKKEGGILYQHPNYHRQADTPFNSSA